MIKKRFLWMLVTILFCSTSTMMLTSCGEKDIPVSNKYVDESIYGLWYALQDFHGSLNGLSCRYIGQAAEFNEDGTGVWYFFLLNDAKAPLYVMGGRSKDYGHFHYTMAKDGTISIKLDTDPTRQVLTMKYQDGKVITPLQPNVVTSQAETRAITRAEAVDDVIAMTSATEEEQILVQTIDGVVYQPVKVNFSLKDTNGKAIRSKELNVSINGGHHYVRNSTLTCDFTVYLEPTDGKTLILSTNYDKDTYVTTIKDVTFEKGKTYDMEVNMMKVSPVQLWKDGPKFANMNLGATTENDFGLFYAWAATTDFLQLGVWYYYWATPYFVNYDSAAQRVNYSKYADLDKAVLEPSDDAATQNWGGTWRMPTFDELKKLTDSKVCSSKWMTIDGVPGCKITGATKGYKDKSIFLPADFFYYQDMHLNNGGRDTAGYYWSASACDYSAYMLCVSNISNPFMSNDYRITGFLIRPVKF